MNLTRRQLVAGVCGLASAALFAKTLMLRRRTEFKKTMTTLFWVGEPADAENAFISNYGSYWDKDWQLSFGGVDDPERRDGYWPVHFRPKENPFYVALPYGEFTEAGEVKPEAQNIPWFHRGLSPLLKNRWIEVRRGGRSCFAQWQDVGPCGEDDFDFVFGSAVKPVLRFPSRKFQAFPRRLVCGIAPGQSGCHRPESFSASAPDRAGGRHHRDHRQWRSAGRRW